MEYVNVRRWWKYDRRVNWRRRNVEHGWECTTDTECERVEGGWGDGEGVETKWIRLGRWGRRAIRSASMLGIWVVERRRLAV